MLEHLLESVDLGSELSNDPGVGILVDDGVIDDSLGAVSVTQRR